MSWVFLASLSAILFAAVHILDKAIIGNEMKDPLLATVVVGVTNAILMPFAVLFFGSFSLDPTVILLGFIAGTIYGLTSWMYYHIMKKEDVDRFVPTLALSSIVVAVLSFFMLGEQITMVAVVGMSLLVFGAMLIGHKKVSTKAHIGLGTLLLATILLLIGLRYIIIKVGVQFTNYWGILPWYGFGMLTVSLIIFGMYHPHVLKESKKGLWHLFATDSIGTMANISIYAALALGPAALVASMTQIRHLFTFGAVSLLSIYHPNFVQEKFVKKEFVKKGIAVAFIIVGAVIISL